MKKRILSILLTLCMLFCLVPTGVFAEGETATGSAAIQLGTDALSKNVNTATAPYRVFRAKTMKIIPVHGASSTMTETVQPA